MFTLLNSLRSINLITWCVVYFEFETHKQKWENNNVGLVIVERQLNQELHETQQRLEKT